MKITVNSKYSITFARLIQKLRSNKCANRPLEGKFARRAHNLRGLYCGHIIQRTRHLWESLACDLVVYFAEHTKPTSISKMEYSIKWAFSVFHNAWVSYFPLWIRRVPIEYPLGIMGNSQKNSKRHDFTPCNALGRGSGEITGPQLSKGKRENFHNSPSVLAHAKKLRHPNYIVTIYVSQANLFSMYPLGSSHVWYNSSMKKSP
jgi:hypothetical protein